MLSVRAINVQAAAPAHTQRQLTWLLAGDD